MMKVLEAAVVAIPSGTKFVAKPHPNADISGRRLPNPAIDGNSRSLSKIMNGFDVAYSSNMTSAALDALLAGLAVVVMLDDVQLNFSPLRGQPGVQFMASPAIGRGNTVGSGPRGLAQRIQFFFLDPSCRAGAEFWLVAKGTWRWNTGCHDFFTVRVFNEDSDLVRWSGYPTGRGNAAPGTGEADGRD